MSKFDYYTREDWDAEFDECDIISPQDIHIENAQQWVSAMAKEDTRTEKEIFEDFYANGIC